LIIDEAIQAHDHIELNLSQHHSVITDHLEVVEAGAKYGQLKASAEVLEDIIKNQQDDDICKLLTKLALRINSPHWTVWVDRASYNGLLIGKQKNSKPFAVFLQSWCLDSAKRSSHRQPSRIH